MGMLVEVVDLKTYFRTKHGLLHAVDGVSMCIESGTTMGVVGESGCGKSTLARTIIRLQEPTSGKIVFDNKDITKLSKHKIDLLRGDMQMIFQDSLSSLNPRYTVEDTLKEALILSGHVGDTEAEIKSIMDMVGVSSRLRMSYPHELSGGRCQRVSIGRALARKPKFIICDEPVSALDVSVQAQILNLLQDLQDELGLAYMFVTHDMSVVRHVSHNISVMYMGQLVETCPAKELFSEPRHPYTKALISAIPSMDVLHKKERIKLVGEIASPLNPKPGCRFAARCRFATEKCTNPQSLKEVSKNHFVACCRAEESEI